MVAGTATVGSPEYQCGRSRLKSDGLLPGTWNVRAFPDASMIEAGNWDISERMYQCEAEQDPVNSHIHMEDRKILQRGTVRRLCTGNSGENGID
jgi:hypothetical protein